MQARPRVTKTLKKTCLQVDDGAPLDLSPAMVEAGYAQEVNAENDQLLPDARGTVAMLSMMMLKKVTTLNDDDAPINGSLIWRES